MGSTRKAATAAWNRRCPHSPSAIAATGSPGALCVIRLSISRCCSRRRRSSTTRCMNLLSSFPGKLRVALHSCSSMESRLGVESAHGYSNSIDIVGPRLCPFSIPEPVVFHADRVQLGRDRPHDRHHVLDHGVRLRRRQYVHGLLRGPLSSSEGKPCQVRPPE